MQDQTKANLIGLTFVILVIAIVMGYYYTDEINETRYELIRLHIKLECPNISVEDYLKDNKITRREYSLFKRDCTNAKINKLKDKLR